jgi:hypothetical protein
MDLTKEKRLEDFDVFVKSIEMIYGKNYFIEYNRENSLIIHLYFDEITIKNSNKQSHVIKDLFVKIIFDFIDDNYVLRNELHGYRTFITQNEANASYCHSHLSINGKFCLGSGPLRKFMDSYSYSLCLTKKYIDEFDEMLLMIFHYVRWESLEGTPYRYLHNIVNRSSSNSKYQKISNEFIGENINTEIISTLSKEFIKQLFDYSTPIQLKENKYILKFNNELLLNIEENPTTERYLFLYKGSDGNLYRKQNESRLVNTDPIKIMKDCYLPTFPIKLESGKIIEKLSTEQYSANKDIEFKKTINKKFLSNIIKYIEEVLNTKI